MQPHHNDKVIKLVLCSEGITLKEWNRVILIGHRVTLLCDCSTQ